MSAEGLNEEHTADQAGELPIREIVAAIKSVSHGSVRIIVQDSKVVQIDRIMKNRLHK